MPSYRQQLLSTDIASLGRLRLVGSLSLWFVVISLLTLLATLSFVYAPGSDYLQHLQRLAISRSQLPLALLIGGTVLLCATALITWLITLFTSWRVAGPLYRLSVSLRDNSHQQPLREIRCRQGDFLHNEVSKLQDAALALDTHYAKLNYYSTRTHKQIELGASSDILTLQRGLDQLRSEAAKVRLPERLSQ